MSLCISSPPKEKILQRESFNASARFSRVPRVKLSKMRTSSTSSLRRASTVWEPIKPAPPMTNTRLPDSSIVVDLVRDLKFLSTRLGNRLNPSACRLRQLSQRHNPEHQS